MPDRPRTLAWPVPRYKKSQEATPPADYTWARESTRTITKAEAGRLQCPFASVMPPFQGGMARKFRGFLFLFSCGNALNDHEQNRHEENPQGTGRGHPCNDRASQHFSANRACAFR